MRWGREVPDDFDRGVFRVVVFGFFVHGGEGAKELVGDVGQDGGAARGDAILGEKEEKAGEEVVDRGRGFEFTQAGGESGGEIGRLALIFGEFGVAGTEARISVSGGQAAALAIGEALATTDRVVDGTGFS